MFLFISYMNTCVHSKQKYAYLSGYQPYICFEFKLGGSHVITIEMTRVLSPASHTPKYHREGRLYMYAWEFVAGKWLGLVIDRVIMAMQGGSSILSSPLLDTRN